MSAPATSHTTTPLDANLEQERIAAGSGVRLDSLLRNFERRGFSGTVLVARGGDILLLKGYGLAIKEMNVRNSPATRFELNSLTKMFTAASILQLAAAGTLGLDDPVARYLGEFPPGKRGATVRQLAHHTAGLIVDGSPLNGESRERFIADVKEAPKESEPGAKYRYTNAGYSLLAAIVEAASGMKYEQYLRERVFAPSGMRHAVFRNEVPGNDPLFAHGYRPASDTSALPANPYPWGTIGAGGVWTTVGDVYRWVLAVENGRVIPAKYQAMLHSPPPPPSLEAFGWHVYPSTDSLPRRIEKGGGSPDFAAQLIEYPDEGIVIIWACNDLEHRWRQELNRELSRIVLR